MSGHRVDGPCYQSGSLKYRDDVKLGGERLLARLVPEDRASRVGAKRSAHEGEREQIGLGRAPLAPPGSGSLRPRLVDPEGCEGHEVDRDEVIGEQFERLHGCWTGSGGSPWLARNG